MFGELALSERTISDFGILFSGTGEIDFNLTSAVNASPVFTGAIELNGTSIEASIGVGIMSGVVSGDINFTQTSAPSIIIVSGAQEYISSFESDISASKLKITEATLESFFTLSSNGLLLANGANTLTTSFTEQSAGNITSVGTVESSFNFIQDSASTRIRSSLSTQSANFTQSSLAMSILNESMLAQSSFAQSALPSIVYSGICPQEFLFIQTADGAILWTALNTQSTVENWTSMSSSSSESWVDLTTSTNAESWANWLR
jgi:hypothetical protein